MPFAALSMFHVASVLFAVATAIAAWRVLPNPAVQEVGFAGLTVLLLGVLLAEGVARRGERRHLLDRIDRERLARQQLGAEVEALGRKVTEGASGKGSDALVAEMRLVRSQLARLSDAPAAPEPATRPAAVPLAQPPVATDLTSEALLRATGEALRENRMDLYLQPVVRLPQRQAAYHECLTRLRDAEGRLITPDQYLPIAERTGMTSTIDNLSLFRCVQTLKARRGPDTQDAVFFCNLSAATLDDAEFFDQFAEFLSGNRDMARQIVFEIGADVLLGAADSIANSLSILGRLGFSLSVDHVETLETDLEGLIRRGARYVKIDCGPLIADKGPSAATVRRTLADAGVQLIATRVEREDQVVDLLEAEIELAQGYLFGEPRMMREDR